MIHLDKDLANPVGGINLPVTISVNDQVKYRSIQSVILTHTHTPMRPSCKH